MPSPFQEVIVILLRERPHHPEPLSRRNLLVSQRGLKAMPTICSQEPLVSNCAQALLTVRLLTHVGQPALLILLCSAMGVQEKVRYDDESSNQLSFMKSPCAASSSCTLRHFEVGPLRQNLVHAKSISGSYSYPVNPCHKICTLCE